MMLNKLSRTLCLAAVMTLLLIFTGVHADQAQYIYDDLGRLSQVIDGSGNVATYTYDAVGNLAPAYEGVEPDRTSNNMDGPLQLVWTIASQAQPRARLKPSGFSHRRTINIVAGH